jgi:zinc/manganese transport system permease protein
VTVILIPSAPALEAAVGAGYRSDWLHVITLDFMRTAFLGGMLVALSAGLLGYFVVIRQNAFAAHALAHIGFPGATGAVLIGVPVTLGLGVFCVGGALVIGLLGRRVAEREVATGTVLAFATGLGVLFNSLTTRKTSSVTNVLFGSLLTITGDQLVTYSLFTLGVVAALVVIGRPLTFASVAPAVAEARGVPVRALNLAFLVLLGLVVTMAVQVVGTLLLFGLVVTPAAAALALTARPAVVAALSTAIALVCVVAGLVVATMFNVPASFVVVSLSTAAWAVATLAARRRRHHADRVDRVDRGQAPDGTGAGRRSTVL